MSDIVTWESLGTVLVVHCHGCLDLANRQELRSLLPNRADLTRTGAGDEVDAVVIDLGDVSFLDCSALGVLTGLARDCATTGTRFLFAGARSIVRQLFTVLDLDQEHVVVPAVADAVVLARSWSDLSGRCAPHPARPAQDT